MRSTFNTAPTSAPEIGKDWDYGTPVSHGTPETSGGSNGGDWGDELPAYAPNTVNEWDVTPTESMSVTPAESNVGERLRDLKDRVIHGMGRKALDAIMNRLPNFSSNGYAEQAGQFAKSAGRETAIAGAKAAGREFMDNVGLNYEEGRVSVASKRKLAKTAFRLVRAPQLEVARLTKKSASAGFGAAKQEGVAQFQNARQNFNFAPQPVATGYEEW